MTHVHSSANLSQPYSSFRYKRKVQNRVWMRLLCSSRLIPLIVTIANRSYLVKYLRSADCNIAWLSSKCPLARGAISLPANF